VSVVSYLIYILLLIDYLSTAAAPNIQIEVAIGLADILTRIFVFKYRLT